MISRNRIFTVVLLLLCALVGHSQSRFERLLPLLLNCDSINAVEFIDNNLEGSNGTRNYVIVVLPTPIEKIPQSVKDSLIAAFEHEYFTADESDRYFKRGKAGDTLSYALAYEGAYEKESDGLRVKAGDYSTKGYKVSATANLDIKGKDLMFDFYMEGSPQHRIQLKNKYGLPTESSEEEIIAMITAVFDEIAANSAIIKQPLSFDGSKNTSGYCLFQTNKFKKCRSKGIRLEVPPSLAEDAYTKMADAMNKVTFTDCSYDLSQEKNKIDIIFRKDCRGEAFLMHRAKDGRVYLFHKEPQEDGYDHAIPKNWYSEDYLENN